ncbi:magnesium transporter MRS2-I isoform X2 [Medicago truncatula]|uniref:magnesium transporter MRS2-I isoform X2 n=1 Tax=Medicago truncatula TaxID=3880 RepID=UPI000D2F194B|nr:magnesium transporter MRS2-I isoform X2 [Medicago truncatula]
MAEGMKSLVRTTSLSTKNSWIKFDANGHSSLLDVDKFEIMHQVRIQARDLRIIDPLLSYPSTILSRKEFIVLNFEHIKAIITAKEVFLQDPTDENIIPVVEELKRRLFQGDDQEMNPLDVEIDEDDESSFEFRALEIFLESICSYLSARTIELEMATYPALDELTTKINARNLNRVRILKSALSKLTVRVQKVYFNQIDGTSNKLITLREYIDDTEDYINIQMDNYRNQLIQLEIFLIAGELSLSFYALVIGIFSMNIPFTWTKDHGYMFKWVVIFPGFFSISIFLIIVAYARKKGLIGS